MENKELKKILSEITDHTNKGMAANLTIKAIRDTMARYPHDAIERVILNALLDQLNEQVTAFSSIWWRIREIEKLDAESEANGTDSAEDPVEPIKDGEEVTDDDLPFC
jgi:HPt (histidine-containing phosphotransfer) domain-containing protein